MIVNPKATTVSSRLKNLVVYALRGRYEVDAVETQSRNHATALTRDAAANSYDLVVAFGGDGTVNEAANGLAGSATPLSILPGGSTNVVCRLLGIPTNVVDATEQLISFGDRIPTRHIDLGRVGDRYFVSSSGVGLDAETTRWVDQRPPLKARGGSLTYAYAAFTAFQRGYAGRPARIAVEADGQCVEGVTAVIQNCDPFTYFGSRPVRICEGAAFDSGTLSMIVFRRASQRDMPGIAWRLLSRSGRVTDHPQAVSFTDLSRMRITALDRNGEISPFPMQVDGDYIGDHTKADFEILPGALRVVA